ncbi:TolC family outer membrane protein [Primorskyibacter sp. S187A]|uniref:TolC family outer membrane protein n=1 Tax=Primorskyibacter sp. S187A TaxID=3415130 RepID=UPI003C7ACA10
MTPIRQGLTSLCMVAALSVTAIAAKAETLADALTAAYMHSGLLDQNRALLRAADEDVAGAVAELRPIINYTVSVRRQFGSRFSAQLGRGVNFGNTDATAGIAAELLIYDGGASRLAVEAAKETVLAARQDLIGVEQDVLLRAAQAYISVIRDAETVSLRRNNLKLLDEELRAARNRFEVGEVTRTDVALAEARRSAAQANLAAARGQLDISREEYAAVVGRKPGQLAGISTLPKLVRNESKAKTLAVRTHPALKSVQFSANAAELNIRRAEAGRKPRVTLEGNLSVRQRFESEDFTESGDIGIVARGPIYQGGAISSGVRQAMARRDAVMGQLHTTRHAIQQNVGAALAQLNIADASIGATRQQIRAAQVAFRGVREEAQLGQRTTLDVLTAEQDLLDARTQLTNAIADRNAAVFGLLAAQGLMTAEHLRLPVQKYDPTEYYNLIKNAPAISKQGDKLDRVLKKLGKQ